MSIKIVTTRADGRKMLIIGLAQGNLDRLAKDLPYLAKSEETKLDVDVVIVFKPRIEDVVEALRDYGIEMAAAVHKTKGGSA